MSITNEVKTLLEADSALTTILTGGIFDFEETGRRGIGVGSTPSAYTNGVHLKPCAIVKAHREYPTYEMRDQAAQATSVYQSIEVWLYEDTGADNIEAAMQRLFELLHDKTFSFGRLQYNGTRGWQQAEELNGASSERVDFQRIFVRMPD